MQAYIRLGVGDDKVEFRNSSLHVRFAVLLLIVFVKVSPAILLWGRAKFILLEGAVATVVYNKARFVII